MEKLKTTQNIDPKHFSDYDIFLFKSGRHFKLYEKFGSRLLTIDGVSGVYFSVWAPAAKKISVIGDFNGWDSDAAPMNVRWDNSGIWEAFLPGIKIGALYKFHINAAHSKFSADKSDPFAYFNEVSPGTASIVHNINEYSWNDKCWMENRHLKNSLGSPISIYELHLGSWKSPADCELTISKFSEAAKPSRASETAEVFGEFAASGISKISGGPVKTSGIFKVSGITGTPKISGVKSNPSEVPGISGACSGASKRFAGYREIAPCLVEYIKNMGFTHVEIMPVMEHPFYGSWGYQVTGFFAPTSRYGEPQDLKYLIDLLHQNNIGVILDWVPSHFPNDVYGLANFDGTCLYEHEDPKKGFHPDWKSLIFNYGRNEVKEFLISSAMFWIDKYHADGLRIDGVASMLYLDYSRKKGEWIPNKYGGRENLEAIDFIKELNEALYGSFRDIQIIAEESTSWPAVTKPKYSGGLGFGMKWNMGWMHDTLNYFSKDPVYRKFHQNDLTFAFWYAFFENFLLPMSHDEVVYGKKSVLEKMPGDSWQQFANLRLLLGYMYSFPGKKLLFMGIEFAQRKEWDHESFLEWSELKYEPHCGIQRLVADLNKIYCKEPALYASDFQQENFEWIDASDTRQSILLFLRKTVFAICNSDAHRQNPNNSDEGRKSGKAESVIVAACNFTPSPRYKYRIGVPHEGEWIEIFNSDAQTYGGSGHGNFGKINTSKKVTHGRPYTISVTLPPLAIIYFKKDVIY